MKHTTSERSLLIRLSMMLFMEIAVHATYAPLQAIHMHRALGFSEQQVSFVYMARPLTSLVAPVAIGWIADRYLPAQICLATMSLVRAVALLWAGQATSFPAFAMAMVLAGVGAWPSLVLAHAISFRHMSDSRRFGRVRVWGAVSWILAVWMVSAYLDRAGHGDAPLRITSHAYWFGAGLSALLGLYSFTLPSTPPSKVTQNPLAFVGALTLFRNSSFSALILASFLIAASQPFYHVLMGLFLVEQGSGLGLGIAQASRATTVAQLLELVLFPSMGTLIHRYGVRPILFTGIVAWPLRFAACAIGSPAWLVIASQLLHGFNIVFAMVGANIAVDLMARSDARASAQALLAVVCDGVGSLLGMLLCGAVFSAYALPGGGHNWPKIYTIPLAMTLLASMLFLALFRERDVKKLPVLEPVPGAES